AGHDGSHHHEDHEERNQKPQQLVADEAEEQRVGRRKQPWRQSQQLIIPRESADLARELLPFLTEEIVASDGSGLKDNTMAGSCDVHGDEYIIQDSAHGNRGVKLSPDGVDGSSHSNYGTCCGLQFPEMFFDLPVDAEGIY